MVWRWCLEQSSYGITQQELIQVGDFDVGFGPRAQEQVSRSCLRQLSVVPSSCCTRWLVAGHRYMSEVSMRKLFRQPEEEMPAHLEAKTA